MDANLDQATLDGLFAELEAAWEMDRDPSVVDRMAAAHPAAAEELYEFFDDLVMADHDDSLPESMRKAVAGRMAVWLEAEGHRIGQEAAAAVRQEGAGSALLRPVTDPAVLPLHPTRITPQAGAAPDRSFVALLEDHMDLDTDKIAERLGEAVTVEFLLETGRVPHLFPPAVRTELAERAYRAFGLDRAPLVESFGYVPQPTRRAASRKQDFGPAPTTFRDVLRRCALTPTQQMYWIGLAKED